MSKATDDPTDSGAPVHIDAALIEAEVDQDSATARPCPRPDGG